MKVKDVVKLLEIADELQVRFDLLALPPSDPAINAQQSIHKLRAHLENLHCGN